MTGLRLGSTAPDFTLRDQFGQDVTLSSYRGTKAVALLFYPFAFSGVCTGEMAEVRDRLADFLTFDTEVLAISCDPMFSLRAFADADGLNFPLLSDFWPHGEVSRAYEVLDERSGAPRRSSYVVDKAGTVCWSVHNALPDGRDLDEHLRQLRAADGASEHPRPLERDEAVAGAPGELRDLAERALDPLGAIHRQRNHREVLREAEQPLGVQPVLGAEPLEPPQQDADREVVPVEGVEDRVSEEAPARHVALSEVSREREGVLAHSAPPSECPSFARPRPRITLSSRLWASSDSSPSSPSRWVSNIQVEKVV